MKKVMKKLYKSPVCKHLSIECDAIIAASVINISNTRSTGSIRGNSNTHNGEWKNLWNE